MVTKPFTFHTVDAAWGRQLPEGDLTIGRGAEPPRATLDRTAVLSDGPTTPPPSTFRVVQKPTLIIEMRLPTEFVLTRGPIDDAANMPSAVEVVVVHGTEVRVETFQKVTDGSSIDEPATDGGPAVAREAKNLIKQD